MSAQFHTPSLGDEVFDLTEPMQTIESTNFNTLNVNGNQNNVKVDVPEPVRPVSAYALFFRDTVSAIKAQNPNTSFDDISKIVHSMWQVLDPAHKNVYNKKSDLAKKEYITKMAAYRNLQARQVVSEESSVNNEEQNMAPNISPKPTQITSRPAVFTISRNLPNEAVPQNNQQALNQVNPANQPPPQNVKIGTDANSVQICIRENCNKRAVINPDWEDEYCSNECVVIHCRNVFNQWVKSNMEGQA